jgi:HK97 family phage major capsid protein
MIMQTDAVRKKTVEAGVLYRAATLGAIDEEARTVELAFSSEIAVDRYFGAEILDHSNKSVVLDWLNTGRAPLLADHDPSIQIGVIERAEIGKDRVGRAVVRFGKGAQSDAYFQDVKDGIRANISVGYRIHQMILEEEGESGAVYRVTKWEPLEISLVAIPADQSVGIGRSADEKRAIEIITPNHTQTENKPMNNEANAASAAVPAAPAVNEASLRANFQRENEVRTNEIMALGKRHGMIEKAADYVASGKSASEFSTYVLDNIGKATPIDAARTDMGIGLNDKEVKQYSLMRAINAMANPHDRGAQEAARFEREASDAAAKRYGKTAQGFMIPTEVLKRDLLVGTATAGGHTVQTNVVAGSFIDVLRNSMVLQGLGATMLTDLQGQVAIPRQTAGATAYWVAENGAPTESQQAFDQVALTPKTVGAFTDISRKLMLQSSIDIEQLVQSDLAKVLAIAIDTAGINGSGSSNQPLGVLNTSGIGSVAGGTNGAIVTWQNLVDLEAAVGNANADVGALAYLTNAKQRGKFKGVTKTSPATSFLWDGGEQPVNGYGCSISNSVPSNLTKGSASGICSAILFGNWADLIIGMWGGLDLLVDPYSGSTAGTIRVVALQDVDIAVRHPESFAAMKDAL